MTINKFQIFFVVLFVVLIGAISRLIHTRKLTYKSEEIRNSVSAKIIDFKYLSRGVYSYTTSDGKTFYSMAFNYIRNDIRVGDSIYKRANDTFYSYYKFDSSTNGYKYFKKCEIYIK